MRPFYPRSVLTPHLNIALQMANRVSQSPDIDGATAAFKRITLGSPSQLRIPSGGSPLRPTPNLPSSEIAARRKRPVFKLSDITGEQEPGGGAASASSGTRVPSDIEWPPRRLAAATGTPFANFGKIVDPSGALNFSGKAVLHSSGVDFSNGPSFAINMNQLQLWEELGNGAYGTVKRVLHKPTNVAMAMKEIRLELDDTKLNAIIMELDILHRAVHPSIVEFYGAFFIESCVYYCMEYMDAGSLDKLYGVGVPEPVLGRIVSFMVKGLKFLKDELQIIHRDVKPTNVLVNKKGDVKLCDFGVSGQLEKSLAKTNIGCQSYMAPERIKGESQNALSTYTVSSDVWSLGLATLEIAIGKYPYPPETYSNVFAQLTAIVHGDPPELPETYSCVARNWVNTCLVKRPEGRATYAELLSHPFLQEDSRRNVDMRGWVARALQWRYTQREQQGRLRRQEQEQLHSSDTLRPS
ncbi:kinase-like protein [Multifurca ochricompacta]|uniref:mitogen-activated protein kinase kinase n=1 Tax=Multifurca ochricompacta TaxID=376703 RepID=A0AAD4M8J5_9AGAM|nr:kinase-like protein [Multifurca ochricompacta]